MIDPIVLRSRRELEEHSRRHVGSAPYGDRLLLCRVLGKYPLLVDTLDATVGPRLVLDGYWEAWASLAVARFVQPGMGCIDVGANYGYYSVLMADGAGSSGRVAACEANPRLARDFLPRNLRLNAVLKQTQIVNRLICDADGQRLPFTMIEADLGGSSMLVGPDDITQPSRQIVARTTTVDALCRDWDRLDLVKIDVEGAEKLVWNGMGDVRRRFPSLVTLMELHLFRPPAETSAFLAELSTDGYRLRHLDSDGEIRDVTPEAILERPGEHWMLWLQR